MRTDATFVILDLRRVNELDSTGAGILLQAARRLRGDGKHLLLSHLAGNPLAMRAALDAGLTPTHDTVFADTDAALEWADNTLIANHRVVEAAAPELALRDIPVLAGLTDAELATVGGRLHNAQYHPGEVVIHQGDRDRSVYIVANGTTTVSINVAGTERQIRLFSYARGTILLSEEAFEALMGTRPRHRR